MDVNSHWRSSILVVSLYTLICVQGLMDQPRQQKWLPDLAAAWRQNKGRKERKANGSHAGELFPTDSIWLCDNVMTVRQGPYQELTAYSS